MASKAAIDPFLMTILSSRIHAIMREMNNTLMRSSRSAIIKIARDFSIGLLTRDNRLMSVEQGIPIHITALELATRPIAEFFDDIKEGDAFLNNCSFTGGTHHADLTLCVPVFFEGELMFWSLTRAHHADTGAPQPSTYLPYARTIYEEGIQLPCIRIQENYEDKKDLIRMCMIRNRVPDLWYGDYRAQVGACWIGERRLKELLQHYGKKTIKAFVEAWIEYGERRAIAEIQKLPSGSWTYENVHDPIPDIASNGIPVKVTVTVDSEKGEVTVDARDNPDCMPGGINLSEACALAACRIGVFYNLDATIPHNEGSASRIKVLLRDGCIVGRPTYPMGTSVATTNLSERLINAVAACFSLMGYSHGMAEGGYIMPLGMASISGRDPRKRNQTYANQIFLGYGGGPALHGYDGWLTFCSPDDGGTCVLDNVEMDELLFPMLVERRHIACDTLGHGEWDGAPGVTGIYRPLADEMNVSYVSDGDINPARGVLGGHNASPSSNWKRLPDGKIARLPSFHDVVCHREEAVGFLTCGGGGYGDPTKRDPDKVVDSVNRSWISPERARQVYNVVLRQAENGVDYIVDHVATAKCRKKKA